MTRRLLLTLLLALAAALMIAPAAGASVVVGQTISTTTGGWANSPDPGGYHYQWEDCDVNGVNCVAIGGATSQSYFVQNTDLGFTIRVIVTASNSAGSASSTSQPTPPVTSAAAPINTVAPTESGTAQQGQTLTATTGTWSNSPSGYTYQWQDCDATPTCTNISGASASTYVLTSADVNQYVRVAVTATNDAGPATAFSAKTAAPVAPPNASGGTWSGSQELGLSTTTCDKYANATGGDDTTGTGTIGNPYASPSKLASVLTTGQVGCLRAGTYSVGNWTDSTANTTITAYPGEGVTIDGTVDLTAAGIDLSYLNIQLSFLVSSPVPACTSQTQGAQSVQLDGNSDILEHDNIYDSASLTSLQRYVPVKVGWSSTSPAQETGAIVRYSRIHDWGAGCNTQAGIYSVSASGQFYDNWIYNDNSSGAPGVEFFDGVNGNARQPHGNHTYANVFDHIGVGLFMWEEGTPYQNNTNDHNVVTNTSHYAGFSSQDAVSNNTFTTSDGFNNTTTFPCDVSNSGCGSVTTSGNITSDPQFADSGYATSRDYRVTAASPVAGYGLWDGDYGGNGGPPNPPPVTNGTWNGSAETGSPSTVCDYYVSTAGSDSHTGLAADSAHAWQTFDKLASMPAGKTGCVESGDYTITTSQDSGTNVYVNFTQPNITITAAPGAAVTIHGVFTFAQPSTNSTASYLNVDENYQNTGAGRTGACPDETAEAQSVNADGNGDVIEHDNLYQSNIPPSNRTGPLGVGFIQPTATGIIVRYNRIHDWGNNCGHGHGVYDSAANSQVYDNWFWGNPTGGACIQFYDGHAPPDYPSQVGPHDDQAYSNVCDNMGLGIFLFGEAPGYANIAVSHNIFRTTATRGGFQANSGIVNNSISFINNDGTNIVGGWPCGSGGCGSPHPVITSGNITSDPGFADPNSATSHDYRLSGASPATSWGTWDGDYSSAATNVLGNSNVGSTASWLDADFKRADCYVAGESGTVNSLNVYLAPTGVAGSQPVQGAVYASGPGSRLAISSPITFSSLTVAGWYALPLTSGLSVTSGTTYCLSVLAGTTTQVAALRVDATGTDYHNANPYTSGPSNPFGTATTSTLNTSLYAVIQ